jgi:hypothetical protein
LVGAADQPQPKPHFVNLLCEKRDNKSTSMLKMQKIVIADLQTAKEG